MIATITPDLPTIAFVFIIAVLGAFVGYLIGRRDGRIDGENIGYFKGLKLGNQEGYDIALLDIRKDGDIVPTDPHLMTTRELTKILTTTDTYVNSVGRTITVQHFVNLPRNVMIELVRAKQIAAS